MYCGNACNSKTSKAQASQTRLWHEVDWLRVGRIQGACPMPASPDIAKQDTDTAQHPLLPSLQMRSASTSFMHGAHALSLILQQDAREAF